MSATAQKQQSPISAEIVNAVIEPVMEVIKSYVGEAPSLRTISVTTQIEPPPWLGVTIELRGNVVGPLTCVVSEGLARLIAGKMLASDDVDLIVCHEAVSELANIITGNATGKLVEAGYDVEISTPTPVSEEGRHLTRRTLVVTLDTAAGEIKMLLGLRIHDNKQ